MAGGYDGRRATAGETALLGGRICPIPDLPVESRHNALAMVEAPNGTQVDSQKLFLGEEGGP